MCYRTKLTAKQEEIEREFDAEMQNLEAYKPREEINGFAHQLNPIVLDESRNKIVMANWGLIPFWAKDDKIQKSTLNARIETVGELPSFRSSTKNRCLIIADAFYEWQWLDPKGKEKQKYIIKPTEQDIFGFAGFYSDWKDPNTGETRTTYTIVTTDANELMEEIHNNAKRMPIIIKKDDRNKWLSGENIQSFAHPYQVDLVAKAV